VAVICAPKSIPFCQQGRQKRLRTVCIRKVTSFLSDRDKFINVKRISLRGAVLLFRFDRAPGNLLLPVYVGCTMNVDV
jgi:hypothetical protein